VEEKDILGEVIEVEREIQERLKAEKEKASKWLEEEKRKDKEREEEERKRLDEALRRDISDAEAEARRKADDVLENAEKLAERLGALGDEALGPLVLRHIERILPEAE
jgi:vacuolar-type H+-ATPase subunit H